MDKEFLLHYFFYICIGFVLSIILMPFHKVINKESRYKDNESNIGKFILMFSFMWGVYAILSPIVLIKNYIKSWKDFLNRV